MALQPAPVAVQIHTRVRKFVCRNRADTPRMTFRRRIWVSPGPGHSMSSNYAKFTARTSTQNKTEARFSHPQ